MILPSKILLVDNDPLFLRFMQNKLQQSGYEVITAGDGLIAIEILSGLTPQVIFIDYVMPNIDGKKLCQIIRRMPHLDHCRLVIVSGAASELNLDASRLEADACIAKSSFGKTAEYILSEIQRRDHPLERVSANTIIGQENVHQRQMTRELYDQQQHIKTLLGMINEGIVELQKGRIIYANPAVCDLLAVDPYKVISVKFKSLLNPAAQKEFERLLIPSPAQDEPMLAKLTQKILTTLGYQVKSMLSAIELLDHFARAPSIMIWS